MINGTSKVDQIIDMTDDFNSILAEYANNDANDVVDLDAWATTDLIAVQEIFTAALEIRAEENSTRMQ